MDIVYLKVLKENPIRHGVEFDFPNETLTISEIEQLEALYNNSNLFPQALRELLFLAGKNCYVLDYGLNNTQQELQEFVRTQIQESNHLISRKFYVIDIYNAHDTFLFIYLDEGDNPQVYGAAYDRINSDWIWKLNPNTLSGYIDSLVTSLKNCHNPF